MAVLLLFIASDGLTLEFFIDTILPTEMWSWKQPSEVTHNNGSSHQKPYTIMEAAIRSHKQKCKQPSEAIHNNWNSHQKPYTIMEAAIRSHKQ